jgi:hypothetical protein
MAEKIRWSIDVRVDGGPAMTAAPSKSIGAYDKLQLTVPAADNGTSGEGSALIQPGTTEQVALLMITASRYSDADLSYELGGETVALDGPQLYTGNMLSLFGSDPQEIEVINDLDTPVTISVLVGRTTATA